MTTLIVTAQRDLVYDGTSFSWPLLADLGVGHAKYIFPLPNFNLLTSTQSSGCEYGN